MATAKTALVTGGGRGIGAGIVKALAAEGWNVAFCGRKDAAAMAETVAKLQATSRGRLAYYPCDISQLTEHQGLIDSVLKDFTALDALVNNAGVAPEVRADLMDMTPESFDRLMAINLRGPFFLTQRVAAHFLSTGHGAIVNIGSISAETASVSRGEYCMSKAGVAMMTRLFAVRLAAAGIPVYELRPGVIHSDMTSCVQEKYDRLIADGLTLQPRWGEPEDVGKAVAMLLRGDLPYSTGQVIQIDGGMSIQRL